MAASTNFLVAQATARRPPARAWPPLRRPRLAPMATPSPSTAAATTATAAVIAAGVVMIKLFWRWRRSAADHLQQPCPEPQPPTEALIREVATEASRPDVPVHLSRTPSRVSLADGQSRFGLDIGGSLLKLIYLELDGTQDDVVRSLKVLDQLSSSRPGSNRPSHNFDAAAVASLGDLGDGADDDGPPIAVMRASESLASPRPTRGVLDPSLTVNVPALGGKLCAHVADPDGSRACLLAAKLADCASCVACGAVL